MISDIYGVPVLQFGTTQAVVKRPMDVQTVRARLESGAYTFENDVETGKVPGNFVADVRLIFENAKQFNESSSALYGQAAQMLVYFEAVVKKLVNISNYLELSRTISKYFKISHAGAETRARTSSSRLGAKPRETTGLPNGRYETFTPEF
eukprot:SAG31_NODE_603_length_13622_cov_19.019953_8_plen_150_part_00